jgi:DNA polymerase-3 subunit alpha
MIYSAKSAIRDLAAVYEIPPSESFKITKEYNDELDVAANIRRNKNIAEYFAKYPMLKDKVDQLIGTISSLGVHAGGVILSDKARKLSLFDYCALQRTKDEGRIASLWTKEEVALLGFIKYDLLGLNSASMVHYARQLLDLNPYEDAPEDEEVFRDIVLCLKHKNIFQFESQLGRQAFEDFLPMSIAELGNATAVIRLVGAEAGREVYNDYKKAVDQIQQGDTEYWKERLYQECVNEDNARISIEVMKDSYGVLIFQEQLANLVKEFSRGQKTFTDGNQCRKALDKHKKKYGTIDDCQGDKTAIELWHKTFMEILETYFLPFIGEDGWDSPDEATQDFLNCKLTADKRLPLPERGPLKWVLSSAAYLFNKLHAIAYSVNTYNMMWLKHYYPKEFWVSSLTCVQDNLDYVRNMIAAIAVENPEIKILAPNVNKSEANFTIEDDNIRYGMSAINGMSMAAEIILEERKNNGRYLSIEDFIKRTAKTKVNKRALTALLFINAFSDFGDIQKAWKGLQKAGRELDFPEMDQAALASKEASFIGGNLTFTHPILSKAGYYTPFSEMADGVSDTCAFRVLKIIKKTTKKNKPYQLLRVTCLNCGQTVNLFDWQNRTDIENQEYLIARVTKNGNFTTLNGPSTAAGKNFSTSSAKKILRM